MNKEKKEKTQNIYVQIVKDFVKENAIILSLMLLAFVSVSVLNSNDRIKDTIKFCKNQYNTNSCKF